MARSFHSGPPSAGVLAYDSPHLFNAGASPSPSRIVRFQQIQWLMTGSLTDSQWRHRSGFSPLSLFVRFSNPRIANPKPTEVIALIAEQHCCYSRYEEMRTR